MVPDDGLSVSERAGAKWTIMKKGLGDWWSKNWPLVLAGGVVGLAGFIAANVLSGGAVLAAIPGILSVLGPLFMGMMAVQVGGYVADYLGKGWAGETKPAGKALAKAVAVGAIELLSYLTFKVGGAAIKGGKAVLAGAKKVGQGALNLAKHGASYVIKQGKVLLKGLSNTGFGKAFKKVGALGKGLLARTKFKGFRLRIRQRRFLLEGKINPWVKIAEGKIVETRSTKPKGASETGSGWQHVDQKHLDSGAASARFRKQHQQLTRQQANSQYRANKNANELDSQKWLNENLGPKQGGHLNQTHGYKTPMNGSATKGGQRTRVETGQRVGAKLNPDRPGLSGPSSSAKFRTAQMQKEAVESAQGKLSTWTSGLAEPPPVGFKKAIDVATTNSRGFGSGFKKAGTQIAKHTRLQEATIVFQFDGRNWNIITGYPKTP